MINQAEHPVAWALLVTDLDEAREHLQDLVEQMARDGEIEEEDYAVQLGHIYAHLNRDWHRRSLVQRLTEDEHARLSRFPKDLDPVG